MLTREHYSAAFLGLYEAKGVHSIQRGMQNFSLQLYAFTMVSSYSFNVILMSVYRSSIAVSACCHKLQKTAPWWLFLKLPFPKIKNQQNLICVQTLKCVKNKNTAKKNKTFSEYKGRLAWSSV
ncbi:UNVERIFIED_CONTAM: hypothetical protein FKN15_055293 [Acipenser sinensis]